MKSIVFIAAVIALAGLARGERIYKPPAINPVRTDSSVKPGLSYSGAAGGSNVVPPSPPSNSRPGSPPPAPAAAATGLPRQGASEFLPQNLTFVISARGLKSKSVDPIVKVSNSSKGSTYEKLGKTEELSNTNDPDFYHVFWIIWKRGTQQKLKLEVRDVDNLRRDDPLGEVTIDLDEYVAKGEKLNLTLVNGTGTVLIQKTTPVKFSLYGRNLPNADTIGKSDPYAEAYWSFGIAGKKIKIGSTAVKDNNENPDWSEVFEFANFMKGTDQYWHFKVLDSDPTGSDLLGEASLEIEPFVQKRQTKMLRIGKTGTGTLAVTPSN